MKKILILICAVVIMTQALIGCASVRKIDFNDYYHEVIGFSESDDLYKPVQQDALLMLTNEDYQEFYNEYFAHRELPMDSPDEDRAVIFIQIPSEKYEVYTYYVKNLEAVKNTLTVTVKKNNSMTDVMPASGFDGGFSWVIFIEADKKYLKDNMEIEIKEVSSSK